MDPSDPSRKDSDKDKDKDKSLSLTKAGMSKIVSRHFQGRLPGGFREVTVGPVARNRELFQASLAAMEPASMTASVAVRAAQQTGEVTTEFIFSGKTTDPELAGVTTTCVIETVKPGNLFLAGHIGAALQSMQRGVVYLFAGATAAYHRIVSDTRRRKASTGKEQPPRDCTILVVPTAADLVPGAGSYLERLHKDAFNLHTVTELSAKDGQPLGAGEILLTTYDCAVATKTNRGVLQRDNMRANAALALVQVNDSWDLRTRIRTWIHEDNTCFAVVRCCFECFNQPDGCRHERQTGWGILPTTGCTRAQLAATVAHTFAERFSLKRKTDETGKLREFPFDISRPASKVAIQAHCDNAAAVTIAVVVQVESLAHRDETTGAWCLTWGMAPKRGHSECTVVTGCIDRLEDLLTTETGPSEVNFLANLTAPPDVPCTASFPGNPALAHYLDSKTRFPRLPEIEGVTAQRPAPVAHGTGDQAVVSNAITALRSAQVPIPSPWVGL